YQLPVINNYVIPMPPPPLQKGDKNVNAVRNGMPRGRRFHSITAPNDTEQLLTKNSGGFSKPSLHSNAFVTMVFLGKSLHLSHDSTDHRDEIKVYQQHCGGENLCVYKGKLLEGETFQFVSKRHHGFPFSLTFFLNGIQVDRLSCCCEYKHPKNTRLGGRRGYFGFLNVEGASPCYRCIIAMGLDKKPSPPKRKMENHEEKHVDSWRIEVHSEPSKSSVELKSSKDSVLVILPRHEESVEDSEDKMETMETEHENRKEE
ncbi:ERIC3 protein, partial [Centropus unirufus]|nr:ERIC3 protein [Centropus unirufus]